VTISGPGAGTTATATSVVGSAGTVTSIRITNPGDGYTTTPSLTVGAASTTGIGTFWKNEVITGGTSGATARVKRWTSSTNILQVGISSGTFYPGEIITGAKSGASYVVRVSAANTTIDKYSQNDQLEFEADNILDFTESNPFGNY
jgi:hypothetical protein